MVLTFVALYETNLVKFWPTIISPYSQVFPEVLWGSQQVCTSCGMGRPQTPAQGTWMAVKASVCVRCFFTAISSSQLFTPMAPPHNVSSDLDLAQTPVGLSWDASLGQQDVGQTSPNNSKLSTAEKFWPRHHFVHKYSFSSLQFRLFKLPDVKVSLMS